MINNVLISPTVLGDSKMLKSIFWNLKWKIEKKNKLSYTKGVKSKKEKETDRIND